MLGGGLRVGTWRRTWHQGFVRAASRAITTFGAPGAGTGANQGTIAVSINNAGSIAGD